MDHKEKRELLKSEYFHLQNTVENFDSKILTFKAWSVTLAIAAFGFFGKDGNHWILLMVAFAAFVFLYLEASWKAFQYSYNDRIFEIEKFFEDENHQITPLQISCNWYKTYSNKNSSKILSIMLWPHVLFPHIFIILGAVLSFIFLG